MTPGTIIAAGYPLIDSERQSLAKRIDAAITEAVADTRKLGWDEDGMCQDHGAFACRRCALPSAKQEERT